MGIRGGLIALETMQDRQERNLQGYRFDIVAQKLKRVRKKVMPPRNRRTHNSNA
jgi:hypothetical protein